MTGLIVIGCILLILLLLAFLRVGVWVLYAENDLCVRAIAGPVKLTVYPMREKKGQEKPEKQKKPKKPKKNKPGKQQEEKAKPPIKELIDRFVPPVLNALGRLRRKLRINKLKFNYVAASSDPSAAALSYGYLNAVLAVLIPLLERSLDIRDQDIHADVSFTQTKPQISAEVQFTIAIWQIVYVVCAVLPAFLSPKEEKTKKAETDDNNSTSENDKINQNGEVEQNG